MPTPTPKNRPRAKGTQKRTSRQPQLVSPANFLLATRDSGYKGTALAVAEFVDNALQAERGRPRPLVGSGQPTSRRCARSLRRPRRLRERPVRCDDAADHGRPSLRPEGRVSVEPHPVSSLGLGGFDTPASKETRMNNVLRNYS